VIENENNLDLTEVDHRFNSRFGRNDLKPEKLNKKQTFHQKGNSIDLAETVTIPRLKSTHPSNFSIEETFAPTLTQDPYSATPPMTAEASRAKNPLVPSLIIIPDKIHTIKDFTTVAEKITSQF